MSGNCYSKWVAHWTTENFELVSKPGLLSLQLLDQSLQQTGISASEYNAIQIAKAQVLNELTDSIDEKHGTGESLAMSIITMVYDNRMVTLGYPEINSNTT